MVQSRYSYIQTLVIILFLSLVSGCSYPLMISMGGQKHVAPVLGVEEEEIEFVQYAYYNAEPRGERIPGTQGIIVVTEDKLVLIEGLLSTMDGTTDVTFSIAELEGVHLGKYQLQLRRGRERVVLWVVTGREDYNGPDSRRLYQMLLEKGVPPWSSEITYQFNSGRNRNLRPRQFLFRNQDRNPVLPTRGEAAYRAGYVTR